MLTRREFIKICLSAAAGLSLSELLLPQVAEALLTEGKKSPLIWLEAMTCTGDFLSFLNTLNPRLQQVIMEMVTIYYGNTIMTAEGALALKALEDVVEREKGEYILVWEGTVSLKKDWTIIGHRENGQGITAFDMAEYLSDKAKYVVAVGSCAAFGGPFAADPNPSNSRPLYKVVSRPVINVPGCPAHPDWVVGTLSHLLLYGVPDLDEYNRPRLFYGANIHDNCPRRQYFENGIFAQHPGDHGCTYKIGCKGPVTFSDCPTRQWIGYHNNWPVGANTPCISCVSPGYPDRVSPFFQHLPDIKLPGVAINAKKAGVAIGGLTAAGIGAHLVASAAAGRIGKAWVEGTESKEVKKLYPKTEDTFEELNYLVDETIKQQKTIKSKLEELQLKKGKVGILHRIGQVVGAFFHLKKHKGGKGEDEDGSEDHRKPRGKD